MKEEYDIRCQVENYGVLCKFNMVTGQDSIDMIAHLVIGQVVLTDIQCMSYELSCVNGNATVATSLWTNTKLLPFRHYFGL